jgi:hypothetical protein
LLKIENEIAKIFITYAPSSIYGGGEKKEGERGRRKGERRES